MRKKISTIIAFETKNKRVLSFVKNIKNRNLLLGFRILFATLQTIE